MPDPEITSYDQYTDEHRNHVKIVSGTLYRHKTLQLSYTTYDMQEDQDRIYQRRYPDVMVLSDDEEHPYLYGRVLDFFHVDVKNNGPNTLLSPDNDTATLQMAWVRWFKLNAPQGPSGFCSLRYPSVSFYESHEPDAFGFIHPDEIIRAVHLIPAFKLGRTEEYLGTPSKGRPEAENDDWRAFHVNMYVLHSLFVPSAQGVHPFWLAWSDLQIATCSCDFVGVVSVICICARLSHGWTQLGGVHLGLHSVTENRTILDPLPHPSRERKPTKTVSVPEVTTVRIAQVRWMRMRRTTTERTQNNRKKKTRMRMRMRMRAMVITQTNTTTSVRMERATEMRWRVRWSTLWEIQACRFNFHRIPA